MFDSDRGKVEAFYHSHSNKNIAAGLSLMQGVLMDDFVINQAAHRQQDGDRNAPFEVVSSTLAAVHESLYSPRYTWGKKYGEVPETGHEKTGNSMYEMAQCVILRSWHSHINRMYCEGRMD